MSKNTCWNFFVKPWLLQQPPETKLLISVASVRGQNLTCNVSFNLSYSLVLWVKIWQIFIPSRLELLKTHHCALRGRKPFRFGPVYFEDWARWKCMVKNLHYSRFSNESPVPDEVNFLNKQATGRNTTVVWNASLSDSGKVLIRNSLLVLFRWYSTNSSIEKLKINEKALRNQ